MGAIHDDWSGKPIFVVFDILDMDKPFSDRLKRLETLQKTHKFHMADFEPVTSIAQIRARQKDVRADHRQEGLVFVSPKNMFDSKGRRKTIVKWKPWRVSRGRIVDIVDKKSGKTLKIEKNDQVFSVFAHDKKTEKSYKTGQTIKFKHLGFDADTGKPDTPRLFH